MRRYLVLSVIHDLSEGPSTDVVSEPGRQGRRHTQSLRSDSDDFGLMIPMMPSL